MVIVRIQSRYLTRGSKVEAGWVAYPAAPVQVLAAFDRTVGLAEPAGEPNAS